MTTNDLLKAAELASLLFPDFDPGTYLMDGKTYPDGFYRSVPLSEFALTNPKNHSIKDGVVWVPKPSLEMVKKLVTFDVQDKSENCTIAFLRTPSGGKLNFVLKGSGSKVLSMSNSRISASCRLVGRSTLIIGEKTFIAGGRIVLFNTDMRVGAGGLWSDEILVQGTDQHGVVDLRTRQIINADRKHVILGRRVWLGRRSLVGKNLVIGDGSIVAMGAVLTKNVPQAVAVGGNPARIIKRGVTWADRPDAIIEREMADITRQAAQFYPDTRTSKWTSWVRSSYDSIWLRASAAGVVGAALFEAASEVIAAL